MFKRRKQKESDPNDTIKLNSCLKVIIINYNSDHLFKYPCVHFDG